MGWSVIKCMYVCVCKKECDNKMGAGLRDLCGPFFKTVFTLPASVFYVNFNSHSECMKQANGQLQVFHEQ